MKVDLSVNIAGTAFRNPVIVASGPSTSSSKRIIRCIRAGAAAAVTKTITYDAMHQVQPKPRMHAVNPKAALRHGFYSFYSIDLMSEHKPELWINEIKRIKKEIKEYDGVIIASIGGRTFGEWEKLSQLVADAGADMIELNLSCPHIEKGELMGRAATSNLDMVYRIAKTVRDGTNLPIIGKLTPHGSNPVELAKKMASSGIDAFVSTARFQGLILDVDTLRPVLWRGFGGYGGPWQLPISLGWTAHIAMENLGIPIIGSGGISTWEDAVRFMLSGASAIQMCTAVIVGGYKVISSVVEGIEMWMEKKGFQEINEFVGLALKSIVPLEELDRRKICRVVVDGTKCTGCGICVELCPYDALSMSDEIKVNVHLELCDNCGLCVSICPFKALSLERQDE